MGSPDSSTNEWIELYNNGTDPVSLSGWMLTSADGSLSISLEGSVSPGAYYLIERTDDDTIPGLVADLVASFGSGLGNSGEILRLHDANGSLVDTVDGSDSWVHIGGNNETKETAQKTESGSWSTAIPTPKAPYSGVVAAQREKTEETGGKSTFAGAASSSFVSYKGDSSSSAVMYPRKNISIDADSDRRVLTGLPVTLSAHALGLYDEELPYATYRWNFGDGATEVGSRVVHTYNHPGSYIATVEVFYSSYHVDRRLLITVEDPVLRITKVVTGPNGYVRIENGHTREIDVSGWLLTQGMDVFRIPVHTVIPAGGALILDVHATGVGKIPGTEVRLLGEEGAIVTTTLGGAVGLTPIVSAPASPERLPSSSRPVSLSFVQSKVSTSSAAPDASFPPATEVVASSSSVAATSQSSRSLLVSLLWLLVLVVLILGGYFLARAAKSDEKAEAEKYAIIEDVIEGDE